MRFLIAAAAAILAAACSQAPEAPEAPAVSQILTGEDAIDELTYARPAEARVVHIALDLDLDFASQAVAGTAVLDLDARDGVAEIILDIRGLDIASIHDGDGNALEWTVGEEDGEKGAPLTIAIGTARQIAIAYSAREADSLQWLSPEQTAGGEQPFLFSQGQAILNRTWIPTQDSPGIRQTYEARITAPEQLEVVMSGVRQGEPENLGDGRRAFRFVMDKPIPPYLIAIAAGDLAFKEIGPRSGVWAEPSELDRAWNEVNDTEQLIDAAEELYGPYRWGRYDMIVLPPAFPYGGMENPVMTFLTPTFIAGDRSNNGLIAHELAHSWSGNLVTNAVWADGWLNEGFTTYFENRIMEAVYGKKRAQQEAALMYASIEEVLAEVGNDAPGTALHSKGEFEIGSAIAYEKGAYFLLTVESIVGRKRFDAWLRQWFDNHAFQPATSALLLEDLNQNLVNSPEEAEQLMLDDWIYAPGLPSNVAKPDPAAFAEVDAANAAYASGQALPQGWAGWTSAERQRFLQNLPQQQSHAELDRLNTELNLSATGNNEELFLWLELALSNRYEPAVPQTEEFLARVGRAKFVRPLFSALWAQGDWGRPIAQRIYAKTRAGYHAVTRDGVDRVIAAAE